MGSFRVNSVVMRYATRLLPEESILPLTRGIQRCAAQAAIVLIARPLFPPFHSATTASAKTSVIQDVDRSNDFSPKTINMLINQIIHQVIALYISG